MANKFGIFRVSLYVSVLEEANNLLNIICFNE